MTGQADGVTVQRKLTEALYSIHMNGAVGIFPLDAVIHLFCVDNKANFVVYRHKRDKNCFFVHRVNYRPFKIRVILRL